MTTTQARPTTLTAHEAAEMLGITINSLCNTVWRRQLAPVSGTWIHSWAFTVDAVEQRIREREDGLNRRRAWNGARPR